MSNANNHNQLPAMPVNAGLDNDNGPVTNEDIRKFIANSSQQMSFRALSPQQVHDRMWQLFKMTVRFTQRELANDFHYAPREFAREFLQKEHLAYALDRERWLTEERLMNLNRQELALQRQCLAAKEAELNDEKRKLAVERLQLEAEKNIVRARQEVPVVVVPPEMPMPEQDRVPQAGSTSQEEDVYIKQEPPENNENDYDILRRGSQTQEQGRERTRSEAGLDKTPEPLRQHFQHLEPGRPAPVSITGLEACVRTTTKVVDLHILKRPYTISRANQRDPNIHTPLITSVISSLFAPENERRLKYWRTFERDGTPDQWFCWHGVLNLGHRNKVIKEKWKCRCEKLWNLGVCVPSQPGCIWVCKDGQTGLLSFVWREVWEKCEADRGAKAVG